MTKKSSPTAFEKIFVLNKKKALIGSTIASIASIIPSIDVYEAISSVAREEEKSYDEAVKDFLEVFHELTTTHKKEVFG